MKTERGSIGKASPGDISRERQPIRATTPRGRNEADRGSLRMRESNQKTTRERRVDERDRAVRRLEIFRRAKQIAGHRIGEPGFETGRENIGHS